MIHLPYYLPNLCCNSCNTVDKIDYCTSSNGSKRQHSSVPAQNGYLYSFQRRRKVEMKIGAKLTRRYISSASTMSLPLCSLQLLVKYEHLLCCEGESCIDGSGKCDNDSICRLCSYYVAWAMATNDRFICCNAKELHSVALCKRM